MSGAVWVILASTPGTFLLRRPLKEAQPVRTRCSKPALSIDQPLPLACRDGDVYIGGRWNELSVLYLIFLLVPLLGLVFAWATHGTLWDTGVYY